ncbi:ABC transporter substrate-binding protein [Synechococcales cyanobacterium C]|uniref:ABC transporter substrate-binding protein n=1 Tax=Petrachloros mirabilis ULC683 TaxID=2781853 RepID=A0A8K2A1U0_9CYAN|nr:iron-siderophore ABC transporter substrate-binding protein [Petrachloros mirabilis]NCJ08278.1 ABC transporter substrate-binding protein [Petrachloros mirabilis ULC683]
MALSSLISLTSCNSSNLQKTDPATEAVITSSDCRVIQHRLGTVCIPRQPKRIITLDVPAILDSLVALDIKPVGSAVDHFGNGETWSRERYFPAVLPELVAGIESVGAEGTPSIEKILELQPDLILLANQSEQIYKQLSAIAPTVLIDVWKDNIPARENFRYIAQLVGQEERAEDVLDQYEKRIEDFRKQLGDRLINSEISVISHYGGLFLLSPFYATYFEVFQDIGLLIKPLFLTQENWSPISVEVMERYDADILFIIEDADRSANFISQNPLILSLESVKNGRAYIVNRKIWDFHGPIGMNLFLDELSKYLLEGKQDPYFQRSAITPLIDCPSAA